jgi:hypothetical protein
MSAIKSAVKSLHMYLLIYFIEHLNNDKHEAPQNLTRFMWQFWLALLSGVRQWLVHHLVYSAPLSWLRERGRFFNVVSDSLIRFLVQCLDTKLRVALTLFWLYCLSWSLLPCLFNRMWLATAQSFDIRSDVDRRILCRRMERNGA